MGVRKNVENKVNCSNVIKCLRLKLSNVLHIANGLADLLTPLIILLVKGTLLIQFLTAYYLLGAVGIPLLAAIYIIPIAVRDYKDEQRRQKILGAR